MSALAPAAWARAAIGGAVGAIVNVAVVLTLGVVAFAPLGTSAAALGIPASFGSVVVSAAVFALMSRHPLAVGGPSSAVALVIAALVGSWLQREGPPADAAAVARLLLTTGAAVVVMGTLQVLMAALNIGRLARFVPQPVLAGFMNGIALLIALAQLPALLSLAPALWREQGLRALPAAATGSLALGLATALAVALLAWWRPRWPGALLGMLAGVAAFHAAQALWPGLALGPVIGPVDAHGGVGVDLSSGLDFASARATLSRHAADILLAGTLLALIGTLESMLTFRALDQQLGMRHDMRRDLLALGVANLAGGLVGALPMMQMRARAASILQAGGRGRTAALAAAAASALMAGAGSAAIAQLPLATLAGVMLYVAVTLVDRESVRALRDLWRPAGAALRGSALTMLLVCGLTVWQGPPAGVAAGMLASTAIFLRRMNRSLVRSRFDAVAQPSRRVHPDAVEAVLQPLRRSVQVLELEGALFFGNAERVADEAEARPPGTRFLVLDLRRVSTVDDSAAVVLQQLDRRLREQGTTLLLAGVAPGSVQRAALLGFAGDGSARWFADTDRAVEHAEAQLLAQHGGAGHAPNSAVPVAAGSLLAGLTPAQQAHAAAAMQVRALAPGEALFAVGAVADGVYAITRGSISVVGSNGQRFVSFSPGTMLGEMALLDGGRRSAGAVADCASEVHWLPQAAFEALCRDDPALGAQLYRNMARHLAQRLRVASAAWQSAAA